MTLRQLRKQQYEFNLKLLPYLNNWKKNPYTWLKARFYMETSAVLVYFLLKTDIAPNTVTILYGLTGILAGILLAIPASITHLIAILLFFSKGILDWSDGHLARVKGRTSVTGAILDPYAALLGTLGFQMGLGFYVAQKAGVATFYYLTALIPFFYAARLTSFSYNILFCEHITEEKLRGYRERGPEILAEDEGKTQVHISNSRYDKAYKLVSNFLDDRARTVDFICLLLLLEIVTPIFITWIVFGGVVIRHFIIFLASFYIVARGGWVEKKLRDKING